MFGWEDLLLILVVVVIVDGLWYEVVFVVDVVIDGGFWS